MKRKWLNLFLTLFSVSILSLIIFCLKSIPAAEAGIPVSVRIASVCGNDLTEEAEECDGADLNGKTCVDFAYVGGTLACFANCTFNKQNCTSGGGGGGGGGGGAVVTTKVILQGKAYPKAPVTVLVDGKVVTDKKADDDANFKIEITSINSGVYTFGVWAADRKGRKSITFSFTLTVSLGTITTVSGIFLPPTIDLDKVNVNKGEVVNILGETAPASVLTISVESPGEIVRNTVASTSGEWDYPFKTDILEEGMHTTRAKAKSPDDLLSSFSRIVTFYIGKYAPEDLCPKADFNKDGKTNLIDFSIMLYWWGKANACVDQNKDGIVNLPDFSILMYWWTG